MDNQLKKQFAAIVGEDRFRDKPEDLISYSYDAFTIESMPDLVLLPVSTEEVSQILKLASSHRIPVTARGTGTSICGAPVPVEGGIVLSLTLMNQILETNTPDRYCIVQPGVINGDLQISIFELLDFAGIGSVPQEVAFSGCPKKESIRPRWKNLSSFPR
jgi:glycolate oxidase